MRGSQDKRVSREDRPTIAGRAASLVVWRTGGPPRTLRRCLAIAALIVVVGCCLFPQAISADYGLFPDGSPASFCRFHHSALSLEIAIHRVAFGKTSHVIDDPYARFSGRPDLAHTWDGSSPDPWSIRSLFADRPRIAEVPLLQLPELTGAPREAYEARLVPFRNNENGLMLLEAGLLRLMPGLTLSGLSLAMNMLKLTALAAGLVMVLRIGVSPALAFGLWIAGLVVNDLTNQTGPLGVYPLLMPLTVLAIAACAGAASCMLRFLMKISDAGATLAFRGRWGVLNVLVAFALGFLAAGLSNCRTSYALIAASLLLGYLVVSVRGLLCVAGHRLAGVFGSLALAAFLATGWGAFDASFVRPFRDLPNTQFSVEHPVWFPIVLALGLPPNALSEREGIVWDDTKALTLAQRVDPEATYFGPTLEPALQSYYFKLWADSPREMASIYCRKFGIVGCDAVRRFPECVVNAADPRELSVLKSILAPLRLAPHGGIFFAFAVAAMLVGAVGMVRPERTPRWFALFGFGVTGMGVMFEAGVIMPGFSYAYQGYLLMWLATLGLLGYQAVCQLCATACRLAPHLLTAATRSLRRSSRVARPIEVR